MREELVSFETAKLAREKGFNVQTFDWYDYTGNYHKGFIPHELHECPRYKEYYAPTQSLLQRWLREEKMVHVEIAHNPMYGGFMPYLCEIENGKYGVFTLLEANCHCIAMHNATYEEALEAGLQYALKHPEKWNDKEK